MNTQTHILLASALLGRNASRKSQTALIVGALSPDLFMLVFIAFGLSQQIPQSALWETVYWSEPWQTLSAISNSIPLFYLILAVGVALHRPFWRLFALAALFHIGVDFLTHASDAHRHFWPLTDWRFHSPISYWELSHYGLATSIVESFLGWGLIIILWRRHKLIWSKLTLALAGVSYVAMPIFWITTLGAN